MSGIATLSNGRAAPTFRPVITVAMLVALLAFILLAEAMATSTAAETRHISVTAPRGSAPVPSITPRTGALPAPIPREGDIPTTPTQLFIMDSITAKAVTTNTPPHMPRQAGLMQIITDTYSAAYNRELLANGNHSSSRSKRQDDVECSNPLVEHPVFKACKDAPESCLRLNLRGQGVCGTIPATLMSDLPNLEVFDVTGRADCPGGITGTIPAELPSGGGGRFLTKFNAGHNRISGSIPETLLNNNDIEEIDVDDNCIEGTLPAGIPDRPKIKRFNVANNRIGGSLPAMSTSLETLNVGNNRMIGSIPDSIGDNTALVDLTLSNNALFGSVPSVLGLLTKLKNLDLDVNGFAGLLPPELGELVTLSRLNMTLNKLAGSLPKFLGNMTALVNLFLSDNLITGPIVDDLAFLPDLVSLFLGNNELTGTIPDFIANLPFLRNLNLKGNKLDGWLPEAAMSSLNSLTYLDLCCGAVSGPIPSQIGEMTNLVYLLLDNNTLSKTIPSQMGSLTKLKLLYMPYAGLKGTIPAELAQLTDLQWLSLAGQDVMMLDGSGSTVEDAGLIGRIPTEVGAFTNMRDFDVGIRNYLSGWLPSEMGLMTMLEYAWVDGNQISGSLPSELGLLTGLRGLFLEGNLEMCGEVPEGLPEIAQPDDPDWLRRARRQASIDGECSKCPGDDAAECPPDPDPDPGPPDCESDTSSPTAAPTTTSPTPSPTESPPPTSTGSTNTPTALPGSPDSVFTYIPYVPNTDELFKNKPAVWFGKILLRYLGTRLIVEGTLEIYYYNTATSAAYQFLQECQDAAKIAGDCVEVTESDCSPHPLGSVTQAPSPLCWNQPACYDPEFENPALADCACKSVESCDCFLCGADDTCCGDICISSFDLCLTTCPG